MQIFSVHLVVNIHREGLKIAKVKGYLVLSRFTQGAHTVTS